MKTKTVLHGAGTYLVFGILELRSQWAVRKVQLRSRRGFHPLPRRAHRSTTHIHTTRPQLMTSNTSGSAGLTVFLQDACLKHQYIRSRDVSTIVERPERVRAVNAGLAVALSRLEGLRSTSQPPSSLPVEASGVDPSNPDDLAKALDQMTLEASTALSLDSKAGPVRIVRSIASVDILDNAAVKFVHGDIDGDVYLE